MSGMWERALEAAADARTLSAAGRVNATANRAYYSVFCVARAALRFVHPDLDQSKTHAGVIRLFGLEIVVKSGLDPGLGEILSKAEGVRRLADYSDDGVSLRQSQEAVTNIEKFLSAVAAFIGKSDSLTPDQNTP